MLQNWIQEKKDITQKYLDNFKGLTEEQLSWKMNSDTWSIAEIMEHIITANESYYPTFKAIKEGTYSTPKFWSWAPVSNFIGKKILQAIEPSRSKKMTTFPVWEPAKSEYDPNLFDRFSKNSEEMIEHFNAFQDEMQKGQRISSPAKRNIVYSLAVGFEAIKIHEKRHLNQALEVLENAKKS